MDGAECSDVGLIEMKIPCWIFMGRFLEDHALAHRRRTEGDRANYIQAGAWRGFAVRDGNLVTANRTSPAEKLPRPYAKALGGLGAFA